MCRSPDRWRAIGLYTHPRLSLTPSCDPPPLFFYVQVNIGLVLLVNVEDIYVADPLGPLVLIHHYR